MQKRQQLNQFQGPHLQGYKSKLQTYPQFNKKNIKHLQNSTMSQLVITQIFQLIFSDSYLYTHPQLISKMVNNEKGYIKIKDLLNMKYVQQLMQVCELYYELSQTNFINYVKVSIQLNSKQLKCNNTSIRRKLPFINYLKKSHKIYIEPYDHLSHPNQQQVQQLFGYVSSLTTLYKAEYQYQYDYGFLYIQDPFLFVQQEGNFQNYQSLSKFDQLMKRKWSFRSYQNLPSMNLTKRSLYPNSDFYKNKFKKDTHFHHMNRQLFNYEQLILNEVFQNDKYDKMRLRMLRNKGYARREDETQSFKFKNPNFQFNDHFFNQNSSVSFSMQKQTQNKDQEELKQFQLNRNILTSYDDRFESQQYEKIHQYQC